MAEPGALTPTEAARLFPRGVGDPWCPNGGRIATPTDHRLLWHLENILAVDAPIGSRMEDVRRDLRLYLNTRCDHHWHRYEGDEDTPAHWQCLWCNDVLWHPEGPLAAYQTCTPADALEDWPTAAATAPSDEGTP